MKLWVQRVSEASVDVGGEPVAKIGRGLLVLLGITHSDSESEAEYCVRKLVGLRIFEDAAGAMNLSVEDVGGEVLVVSQFTLYGDTRKGNRPGFSRAAGREIAEPLYQSFLQKLRQALGSPRVGCGRFGAEMQVSLINDGPVSIEICSEAGACS